MPRAGVLSSGLRLGAAFFEWAGRAFEIVAHGFEDRSRSEGRSEETHPFEPGGSLIVQAENGGISVEAWDRNEARLVIQRWAEAPTEEEAAELLEEIEIEIAATDGRLEIKSHLPSRDQTRTGASFRLTIPNRADLDLGTFNGSVKVQQIAGDLNLTSSNGRIEAHGVDGAVTARTQNGAIVLDVRRLAEAGLSCSTRNGAVKVFLPDDTQATVHAQTTHGRLETDFPLTLERAIGHHRMEGEIGGGGAPIELEALNGSLRLRRRD